MNICVIGCGYVGLVTGAVFADLGNEVICVDVDAGRIEMLRGGECPIYEPRLPEMLSHNQKEGRLSFTTDTGEAVRQSEIVFICVGTPPLEDGRTDLSQVESAAKDIAHALNGYKIIVNKSTVPVGTGDLVRRIIDQELNDGNEFDVVSNPEFLREGQAIRDSLQPDRIVIGTTSSSAAKKIDELYGPLEAPIIVTDIRSAEIIKYASNAFLAAKISFINSVADLCENAGGDIEAVAEGIGSDARIGHSFLNAGLGFGGSCFPKDIESFLHTSAELNAPFSILEEVMEVNAGRTSRFVSRIVDRLGEEVNPPLEGKQVAVLGLSFKPDTDDMREAKSIEICRLLRAAGARLHLYDPVAMENAKRIIGKDGITYHANAYEATSGADAAVIVTEWREFSQLNLGRLKSSLKTPILFDGRNIYSLEQVARAGIEYHSIGRPSYFPE